MQRQSRTKLSRRAPAKPKAARPGETALLKRGHHLINAKLKPPQAGAAWIERRALLARLDRALERKLVLVTAPLGSGKTTLLSQWYQHAAPARPIAWLSLDEPDNEPVRFFSYLIGAVRSTVEDFGAYIASRLHDRVTPPLDHVAAVFVQSLGTLERELVIVLDDFQYVADPAILRAFQFLLHRAPPNVHWIVSARRLPELNLGQLRLEDQLEVIDAAELNFEATHIAQLGRKLCRASLSPRDVECIRARTEGWVAGAKLALLSARDPAHPGESLEQFAGSHAEVGRYLADSVLREQPAEVREFLLASSIVDKMNGDLCNALAGIDNGQALLERLEQAQLFIQPLDSHRQWYRYHVLFLDFLRGCLRREAAARIPALHRAASRWFAEHQMYEEALTHAFAAGERAWCIELTARCVRAWLNEGEIAEVLRWTGRLEAAEVYRHRDLCIGHVGALILSRRFTQAAAALREAQPHYRGEKSALDVLHLMLAILADTAGADTAAIDESLLARADDPFLSGTLLVVQAYRLLRQQQFDAARRLAMRARDVLAGAGSVYGTGYTDMVMSLADRAQGNLKAAAESCERAYVAVKSGRRNPAWVNAATALAHVRYEQNRLAEAEALCVEVLPLLSVASTVENFAIAYVTFARIKCINGRYAEAFQLLDYLHSVLESGGHRRFVAQVGYEKIRLALLQKQYERARTVARDLDLPQLADCGAWRYPRPYDEAWERLGFAQAALLAAEQRYDECRATLEVLRDAAHAVGYVYREVPLQAALAVCHWRAGAHDAAFEALNRGFALTQRFGFTRSIFDDVPALHEVIAAAMRNRKLSFLLPAKYFKKFQDIFAAAGNGAAGGDFRRKPALPLEPLTDRELEMLKLLAQGLSNQEISERSRIALSTAKWHLKNVFAKLDVSTRTGALARARELQLID